MAKQVLEGLQQLDPGVILADENSRFGLKRLRVDSLMQSILEQGGVMQPVEVEPLATPVDGKTYRLTAGFYRHAAVSELNDKSAAGLTLPAQIKPLGDSVQRLKRQLAENMERENQSPMDKAIAIQKLVQAGVPKMEIRKIFSTPGGRKGLTLQPASNAFINMTLSFLDLPKAIQEKIHDGRVGVAAAYELTKVHPEKRAEILEKAEAARLKVLDAEEADEKKFLDAERKAQEARDKENKALEALKQTEVDEEAAKAEVEAKRQAAVEAYKASVDAKGVDKVKADEHLKSVQAEIKAAEKKIEKLGTTKVKLAEASDKAAKLAAEKSASLATARKAAKTNAVNKGKTAVGPADVKKAAAEGGNQYVALTASEMRKTINDLAKPGVFPKVRAIAECIKYCFDGVATYNQMYSQLAVLTGEKAAPKGKQKAAAE